MKYVMLRLPDFVAINRTSSELRVVARAAILAFVAALENPDG